MTFCIVAEEQKFACQWIDLRVRREWSRDGLAERAVASRAERRQVDLRGGMRFFQCQQPPGMVDHACVRDTAIPGNRGGYAGQLLIIGSEQRPARLVLGEPFRRANPAVAVADAAVLDVESMQHSVSEEPMSSAPFKLRIGAIADEGATKLSREVAFHAQMGRVALHRDRGHVTARLDIAAGREHPMPLFGGLLLSVDQSSTRSRPNGGTDCPRAAGTAHTTGKGGLEPAGPSRSVKMIPMSG